MKNLTKEKRDHLIIVAIGTLGVLAGFWFGVVKNQSAKIEAKQEQLTALETELRNAERIIEDRDKIQQELDADKADLNTMETAMVQGDMYSWMVLTLNRFKADHNITIPQISRESLDVDSYREGFPYEEALFKIQGSAHYHDLGKFIAAFENEFPHMKLQNLRLSASSRGSAPLGELDGSGSLEGSAEELSFDMEIVTLIKPTLESIL